MKYLKKNESRYRFVVLYDPFSENDKIYGIAKLDTENVEDEIRVTCFNEQEGVRVDVDIREVSEPEWETYKAFELFPVLTPYDREDFPMVPDHSTFDWGIDFHTPAKAVYRIRLRDCR